ncbi:hypothetical protein CF15_02765 [Pyrodictium occultum]|uniref:Preprotein translocase subunit SecG n=1 Tax=Pyrodictium occultum TaxID=2309 RepID=A0A0V8RUJ9_PYROC|nr:preprotein translocase subunit Sec61beta [Pyrodictium occultum]KSW11751.1 hypothetical protein CF15_02765 [Pyrodictium occultum]
MARGSNKKKSSKEEKSRDTSPTVFTAAGLLAFSEEEALVKLKPTHVVIITVGFIAAVVLLSII